MLLLRTWSKYNKGRRSQGPSCGSVAIIRFRFLLRIVDLEYKTHGFIINE